MKNTQRVYTSNDLGPAPIKCNAYLHQLTEEGCALARVLIHSLPEQHIKRPSYTGIMHETFHAEMDNANVFVLYKITTYLDGNTIKASFFHKRMSSEYNLNIFLAVCSHLNVVARVNMMTHLDYKNQQEDEREVIDEVDTAFYRKDDRVFSKDNYFTVLRDKLYRFYTLTTRVPR